MHPFITRIACSIPATIWRPRHNSDDVPLSRPDIIAIPTRRRLRDVSNSLFLSVIIKTLVGGNTFVVF
jgi:hypothetical protein